VTKSGNGLQVVLPDFFSMCHTFHGRESSRQVIRGACSAPALIRQVFPFSERHHKLGKDRMNRGKFGVVPGSIYQHGIKPGPLLVLTALFQFADKDHQCFPAMSKLSEMTSICPRAMVAHVKHLEDIGAIVVTRDKGFVNGRWVQRQNRYDLSPVVSDGWTPNRGAKSASLKSENRGAKSAKTGVQNPTITGVQNLHFNNSTSINIPEEEQTSAGRGGRVDKTMSKFKDHSEGVEIPSELISIEGFMEAWGYRCEQRRSSSRTKFPTPRAVELELKRLTEVKDPVAILEKATSSGYIGLVINDNDLKPRATGQTQTEAPDWIAEMSARAQEIA
jgi:hypothetical protein